VKFILSFLCALFLAGPVSATIINFTAAINESQTVPPSGSPAFGTAVLQFDDVLNTLSFVAVTTNVLLQGIEVAAQLHFGAPGVNGAAFADLPLGPLKNITFDLTLLGACATLTDCTTPLLAGNTYVLLATEAFGDPQGEIRGQIIPVGTPVPEPDTLALGILGLTGLFLFGRKPA
jgi:hypothetical protein